MKTKAQKAEALGALGKALPDASITIFTTFARAGEPGLTVAQLQELKRALRQTDGEYLVAKKTLADKAMQAAKYDGIDIFGMEGSIGIVLGHGDIYAVAKALYGFATANPALKLFAAWTDGHALSKAELTDLATLPSRDELLSMLLGMLQAPMRQLAVALDQIAAQKAA